jgi:molybdopterin-guanine dinucleotide biosynthesis protein B
MKVFGFTGPSGSGKTTLIEKLIPIFTGLGLRVSVIKHTHHDFDVDRPGKDSWRQRQAGALEVLLTSDRRWVLMHELRGAPEPDLPEQLAHLSTCDLVLVEGFKRQPIPKLEVWRAANDTPLLQPTDATIVAIAADMKLDVAVPIFGLDQQAAIAQFILGHLGMRRTAAARAWRERQLP